VLVPTVLLPGPHGERAYDLYSRLLTDRIVFLGTAIDEQVANLVVGQLLHLDAESPGRPISLYVNSPGGEMTGFFAILDTMQYLQSPVSTICVGQAASAAAVLLAAGEPGQRYALPNARVLLHQPHGGAQGQSVDIEIQVREMVEMRERMVQVLVAATGNDEGRITADLDRDFILRGEQAVEYGVIDQVLSPRAAATVTASARPA
jgi:ATP-dependent Clp protease protease subunit